MAVYNRTGSLLVVGGTTIEVRSGSQQVVKTNAQFLNFSGSAVESVSSNGDGINIVLAAGAASSGSSTVQWTEGSPSPRLRTTASVAIGTGAVFAQTIGSDVFFYVSGSIATGSTNKNAVFGGSIITSGNLYIQATAQSQSFIDMRLANGDPEKPSPGRIRLYATHIASRSLLKVNGPSGLGIILQPGIFNNSTIYAGPNTTTTLTTWGTNFTTSGTIAHLSPIWTSVSGILGTSVLSRFTLAALPGNGAGLRSTTEVCWRGAFSGSGGWFSVIRFGNTLALPSRGFWGFNSINAFLGHTTDISASTNFIGMGWDRLDPLTGAWRIMRRDAVNYVTEEIPNFRRDDTTGSIIDFISFAEPNSTGVYVQVIEHRSTSLGMTSQQRWFNFYTSSIPSPATFLRLQGGAFNHTGSIGTNWFLKQLYLETDF